VSSLDSDRVSGDEETVARIASMGGGERVPETDPRRLPGSADETTDTEPRSDVAEEQAGGPLVPRDGADVRRLPGRVVAPDERTDRQRQRTRAERKRDREEQTADQPNSEPVSQRARNENGRLPLESRPDFSVGGGDVLDIAGALGTLKTLSGVM
jgi:hypothetical protein